MNTTAPELPLTAAQSAIWFSQQLAPDNPVYNTADYILIEGPVDPVRFESALRDVVAEADCLHAGFSLVGETPRQVLTPSTDWSLSRPDFADAPDPLAAAEAWMARDVRDPVDLAVGPLFAQALIRLADDRWVWYQRVHHIAVDGYTFSLLARRVAERYDGAGPERVFGTFTTAVQVERDYLDSERHQTDRTFWRGYLDDAAEPVGISDGDVGIGDHTVRVADRLTDVTAGGIRDLASALRVGRPDVWVALTAVYLHRVRGVGEAVIGLPVMGRMGTPLLRVPAMVMNIVPLRVPVSSSDTLADVARAVAAQMRLTRRHHRYRHEWMRRDRGLVGGRGRLFGPVVNVMPFDNDLRFDGARARMSNIAAGPVEEISLGVRDFADGVPPRLELDGSPALYTEDSLRVHQRRLLRLLTGCLDEPDRPVGGVPLDTVRVRPWRAAPEAPDVIDLIRARAAGHPTAPALEHDDTALDYAGLIERVDELAGRLRQHGAGPETLVAVPAGRGPTP